jgi:uncharacterized protein YebE (UPF0316 family)
MAPFDWYGWVILPIIVFFARITDVTLGTMRIIFTSRGKRNVAPFLGFFETLIWVIVISQIVKNVHSITAFVGYAAGFATGTYVGMLIEDKLAFGTLILRVILPQGGDALKDKLTEAGFGVTVVDGEGSAGPVKLIYSVIKRKNLPIVTSIVHTVNPKAFYSVEEVRSFEQGIFPESTDSLFRRISLPRM